MQEIGTTLGVRFEAEFYPVDGFQLRLTNDVDGEVYYDNRMIGYTLYEAILKASAEVWEKEMAIHNEDGLPTRIAEVLGVEEAYSD